MGTADEAIGSTAAPAPAVRRSTGAGPARSNWLLYVAIALFVIGLISLVVLMVYPAIAAGDRAPGVVGGLTLALPAGLLAALIFALVSGRRVRNPGPEHR